ncbi:vitamin K epoxide reductase family protein [Pedobacter sp.]|nr:vitamin K epoxide reductase family protein [Candidatus Saccharibacteria bacterium]
MAISALLSLIAAFVLSVEAFTLANDSGAALSCNINVILNCASVMQHPSAELFGFPNSFLGLIAEPIVITVAIAGLVGIHFPRSFMAAAQIGYGLGLIFAFYLFFISAFVIEALCPWCLLVTLSTTLVFASLLRYNIREDNLYLPKKMNKTLQQWVIKDYDKFLTALILFGLVAFIFFKYGTALFA